MRWKGIIFLAVVAAIFIILSFIFTDRWLENQLEDYGSAAVGANVEFDGVYFSVFGLQMSWERLQVTDPKNTMTNLFETARCDFDLDLIPLLSKKYIIEDFQLQGLRFHTPRETDGKLPEQKKKELRETPEFIKTVQKHLEKEASQMPVFKVGQLTKKLNVDSVYALLNLQSPQKIDSLKKVADFKYQQWQKRFEELPNEKDFAAIESKAKSLDPQRIKGVDELQKALVSAKELQNQLNGYEQTYNTIKNDFDGSLKLLKSIPGEVEGFIQDDYRRALSLAKLPDMSVKNIARILFGRQIIDRMDMVTGYVGTARYYAEKYQAANPKEEKPPRLKGQYIHFGKINEPPKFWIKKMGLSGEVQKGLQISGNAENVVSNQKIIGKPTTFDIGGTRADQASLKFDGVLNYLGDTPEENFNLNLTEVPLSNVKLTDFALLPPRIASGKGFIQASANFSGSAFLSNISFDGKQIQFAKRDSTANLNPRLLNISRSITDAIKEINFSATAQQKAGDFSLKINSNLDNLIADQLKNIASGEIQAARQKLEARIKQETDKYKQELNTQVNTYLDKLNGELAAVKAELDKYDKQINQLQKDIEKKIKDAAGNKLKDILKF